MASGHPNEHFACETISIAKHTLLVFVEQKRECFSAILCYAIPYHVMKLYHILSIMFLLFYIFPSFTYFYSVLTFNFLSCSLPLSISVPDLIRFLFYSFLFHIHKFTYTLMFGFPLDILFGSKNTKTNTSLSIEAENDFMILLQI